jgi:hypothetical protein
MNRSSKICDRSITAFISFFDIRVIPLLELLRREKDVLKSHAAASFETNSLFRR